MKWFGVALGASFVVAVIAALFGTQAAHAAAPATFAEQLLVAHNLERDRVGVPRLAWSAKLATQAQAWADQLARSNRFEHAPDRDGAGENLWMGPARRYSAEEMIGGFVEEVRYFRMGQFPDVSTTGRWSDVGHYTQLIWRGTQQVGCAVGQGRDNDILVCRYWPAGNVVGQPVN
jgi:hypothetical protein